jgi:hypothetical protein
MEHRVGWRHWEGPGKGRKLRKELRLGQVRCGLAERHWGGSKVTDVALRSHWQNGRHRLGMPTATELDSGRGRSHRGTTWKYVLTKQPKLAWNSVLQP